MPDLPPDAIAETFRLAETFPPHWPKTLRQAKSLRDHAVRIAALVQFAGAAGVAPLLAVLVPGAVPLDPRLPALLPGLKPLL